MTTTPDNTPPSPDAWAYKAAGPSPLPADAKTQEELALILRTFRLEGERVIRLKDGKEALGTLDKCTGYFWIRAGSSKDGSRRKLRLHRVKFALAYKWLPQFIDHIDGNSQNNAIANLRPCTLSENQANSSHRNRRLPKSGQRHVYELPNGKFEWRAVIEGQKYRGGPFDTVWQAKEAVEAFKRKHRGGYYRRNKSIEKKGPLVFPRHGRKLLGKRQ